MSTAMLDDGRKHEYLSGSETASETAEQEKSLLQDGENGIEDTEGHVRPLRSHRGPKHYTLRVAALSSFLVLLVLVVLAALFAWPFLRSPASGDGRTQDPKAGSEESESTGGGPYRLSREWNYDAKPTRREFHWTISDQELNPDGVYRPMTVINGQYPGPLVEVNDGDTVVVHVDNQAVYATSLHFHGLYQNGTNWMDGTVGVTQCPIAPGAQFTYEFKIEGQYGTYWYHSHQGVQAADGIVGPFIIHSKEEMELQTIEYATDSILMITDHYHDTSSSLLMSYLASDMENAEPVPDGGLINGRNVQDCDKFEGRKCDNSTASLSQFNLDPQRNHRLRILNVGVFAEFQVTIDEHNFAVTEVDGTVVQPAYYERLSINPAQRYSIVVNANHTSADSFWLRAKMLTKCFTDPPPHLDPEVRAIIKYASSEMDTPDVEPDSRDWDGGPDLVCRDMDTSELVPAPVVEAPRIPDAVYHLRSNFEIGDWRLTRGFFNQSSWRADVQHPILQRTVDGLASGNESFANAPAPAAPSTWVNEEAFDSGRELVIQTTGIQVIDIVITNFDDGNHPIHLHGYKFFVIGQGHGYPPANLSSAADTRNPLRRDTASVEAFGWTALRLVADNPGAWALHCHVTWHAEAGLFMNLVTRSDKLAKLEVPAANRDLCLAPRSELLKGAAPADEVFMHGK